MKLIRRGFTPLLVSVLVLGWSQPAHALDPAEYLAMIDVNDVNEGMGIEQTINQCPDYQSQFEPDEPVAGVYRTFTDQEGNPVDIRFDVWHPRITLDSYPALVVAHGGGWKRGCRRSVQALAYFAAGEGFITFSIDYRLSCPFGDPNSDEEIRPLCGWNFPKSVDDVQVAVGYVRQHADEYGFAFNNKVAGIGASAGGHLLYMAGTVATAGSGKKPNAVAGLSGPTEMGYLVDGRVACEVTWPDGNEMNCNNREQFMGFPLGGTPQSCMDNWKSAAPYCQAKATNKPPPTFIANATEEHIGYPEATDFRDKLDSLDAVRELSSVDGSLPGDPGDLHHHGTQLLPDFCAESDIKVFDAMMDFLDLHT